MRAPLPSQALKALNDVLLAQDGDRFCTVAVVRLRRHADSWTATIGVGGHPLPMLVGPGRETTFVGRAGSLLGVLPEPTFHDTRIVLRPDDAVVLYTDGVTEGRRGREFYGVSRLAAVLAGNRRSALAMAEGVAADVLRFQGGDPRDDMAVVTVRVHRLPPTRIDPPLGHPRWPNLFR